MSFPGADAVKDAGKQMDQSFPSMPEVPCIPCAIAKLKGQVQDAITAAKEQFDPCQYLRAAVEKAQAKVAEAQAKVEEYHAIGAAQIAQSESDFGGLADMAAADKHAEVQKRVQQGEEMYQRALDMANKAQKMAQDALAACEGVVNGAADTANQAVEQGAQQATDAYKSAPIPH
jgi:hypothetical protein